MDAETPRPITEPRGPEPSGPELRVRAAQGTLAGGGLVVLAAVLLTLSALHGGPGEALRALPAAAALTAVAWAFFLSPALQLRPDGIELVRGTTRSRLAWTELADAEASWGLRLTDTTGRTVTWTGPAGGRRAPDQDVRDVVLDHAAAQDTPGSPGVPASHRRAAAARALPRTGGSLGQRRRERGRAANALPLHRWTDPTSTARESVRLSARETALVVETYAQARAGTPGERRSSGGRGWRHHVRWEAVAAVVVPTVLAVLASTTD